MTKFLKVEGHGDLVRDTGSTAILNTNRPAYEMAKKTSCRGTKAA